MDNPEELCTVVVSGNTTCDGAGVWAGDDGDVLCLEHYQEMIQELRR